jgi:hypothetical protein
MSAKSMLGVAGMGAALMLAACGGSEEQAAVTPAPAPAEQCQAMPGVYAQVADARPVNYGGDFAPGYIAVTDTSQIQQGAGQPNAIQYRVVTNDGRQLPLVAREQYRRGDQLYIEADTCDRARVTVIQELG